jgi:hypothetical protein
MTITTGSLNDLVGTLWGLKEMAAKAHLAVYTEVLVTLKMAVACSTRNLYAVNCL